MRNLQVRKVKDHRTFDKSASMMGLAPWPLTGPQATKCQQTFGAIMRPSNGAFSSCNHSTEIRRQGAMIPPKLCPPWSPQR